MSLCIVLCQIKYEPINLGRCASPQCRSAGGQLQREAAASVGLDPGPPLAGASCSERPGRGHGGGDEPEEEREAQQKR